MIMYIFSHTSPLTVTVAMLSMIAAKPKFQNGFDVPKNYIQHVSIYVCSYWSFFYIHMFNLLFKFALSVLAITSQYSAGLAGLISHVTVTE